MTKTKRKKILEILGDYHTNFDLPHRKRLPNVHFVNLIVKALNDPEEQQIEEIPVTKTFGRVKMNEMIRAINKLNDLN